ncbi:hypothetical protein GCK72_020520 [Caenorhabditis remanei]|uniref:BED-type domain-containing protein n=1 Tax=Caenorhabditis remanei TaxID=31234 RepID=A0A6A5GGZ7_CAERE|nr:hypothetical protein GCK72_020520 [Caenorhabditis remanei]KAF1753963.1 hypothetical protein GCK72_020520 [Caenorhabditis remanei]
MTPPSPKKVKINVKNRSIVWKFFKGKIDPSMEYVDCPSCGKRLKYLGTTSGLKNHIENMHGKEIEEIIQKERTAASSDEKSNEEANRELAKAFATGLVPFRFAENPEFQNFLQKIPDDYVLPNAMKMRVLIDEIASNHVSKVKKQLEPIGKFTLLSDGFSDRKRDFHFYSAHFLALRAVKKGDSASIGEAICDILNEFGLEFSNCSTLTADAGSPLVSLADRHQIDSMSSAKGINVPLPLPIAPTRWGGISILLCRYLAHHESAKNLADFQHLLLKSSEIDQVRQLSIILKPVHDAILRMERDSSFASEIVPTLIFLQTITLKSDEPLAQKLADLVRKRLDTCMSNYRLLSTMLCDHRYAYVKKWIEPLEWKDVEAWVETYDQAPPTVINAQRSHVDNENIDEFLNSSLASDSIVQNDIKSEFVRYRALLTTNRPTCSSPLDFWKTQSSNFERLSVIALELLASPASSSVSERTFSRCSDFVRQRKRNRAKLETLNNLLTVSELSKIKRQDRAEFSDNENCFEQSDDEYSDSGDESEDDDDVISSQRGRLDEEMNDSDE